MPTKDEVKTGLTILFFISLFIGCMAASMHENRKTMEYKYKEMERLRTECTQTGVRRSERTGKIVGRKYDCPWGEVIWGNYYNQKSSVYG